MGFIQKCQGRGSGEFWNRILKIYLVASHAMFFFFHGGGRWISWRITKHVSTWNCQHGAMMNLMQNIGPVPSKVCGMVSWHPVKEPYGTQTGRCRDIPSLKLTARTWKWMVGRLVSFWDALFQVRTVSFRECKYLLTILLIIWLLNCISPRASVLDPPDWSTQLWESKGTHRQPPQEIAGLKGDYQPSLSLKNPWS